MNILKKLTADKIIWQSVRFSFVLLFITLCFILFTYQSLPPLIPVYNQRPWGLDRLGGKLTFFLPILLAGGVLLLNSYLVSKIYEKMPLIARILAITGLLVTVIAGIFIFRMTQLLA